MYEIETINGVRRINLPYMEITELEGRIVRFAMKRDLYLTMETAMEMVEACRKLYDGKIYRSLKIVNYKMQLQDEVVNYLASDARKSLICAEAVVVKSPTLKMFGNFYIKIKRPKIKTRIFDDEKAAIKWLLSIEMQ